MKETRRGVCIYLRTSLVCACVCVWKQSPFELTTLPLKLIHSKESPDSKAGRLNYAAHGHSLEDSLEAQAWKTIAASSPSTSLGFQS